MQPAMSERQCRVRVSTAQTPQTFAYAAILKAHEAAAASGRDDFTDDASIAEWAGLPVKLVEGSPDTVKLTLQRDIAMADAKLSPQTLPDVRTGNGYDVHQLVPGDGVTLWRHLHRSRPEAQRSFRCRRGAACADRCAARHLRRRRHRRSFPPSDPQWKGAPSRIFSNTPLASCARPAARS